MKNFILQMFGGFDGEVSSKRVCGFITLILQCLLIMTSVTYLIFNGKLQEYLMPLTWLLVGQMFVFFGLTSTDNYVSAINQKG